MNLISVIFVLFCFCIIPTTVLFLCCTICIDVICCDWLHVDVIRFPEKSAFLYDLSMAGMF